MYWDLTLQEIEDIIESYGRQKRQNKKERVEELFMVAEVTSNRIISCLNSNASESNLLRPWHFYPDLFEDQSEEIGEQREAAELEKYKARFNKGVAAWNRRFEKEHQDGSGEIGSQSNGGDD